MKKFIAFLLVFGILLSPSLSANTSSGKDSVKKLVLKPTNPRPRDVTHDNVVECTVDNGWLSITFEEPEGWATVTLKDAGINDMASGTYDTASIIKFPLLHTGNPIQILIHTTEGNEYEGWIE
jgi:hypothetical protein